MRGCGGGGGGGDKTEKEVRLFTRSRRELTLPATFFQQFGRKQTFFLLFFMWQIKDLLDTFKNELKFFYFLKNG